MLGGEVSLELRYIQGISRAYDQDVYNDDHRTWSVAVLGGYAYSLSR